MAPGLGESREEEGEGGKRIKNEHNNSELDTLAEEKKSRWERRLAYLSTDCIAQQRGFDWALTRGWRGSMALGRLWARHGRSR